MTNPYYAEQQMFSAAKEEAHGAFKLCLQTAVRIAAVALAFFIPLNNLGTSISAIAFFVLALMTMTKPKFSAILHHPLTLVILIYATIYMFTATYSIGDQASVMQGLRKMSRLLLIPLFIPYFNSQRWRSAAVVSFITAALLSIYMSYETAKPVFRDPIFTSLFIAFAGYTCLTYLINLQSKLRWLSLPFLMLFAYYLFFIATGRTGQILFVALVGLAAVRNFGKAWRTQLLALAIITLIIVASVLHPSSFARRQSEAALEIQTFVTDSTSSITSSSTGARLAFAQNAIQLIKKRPLFGWGAGGFANAYAQNISPQAAKGLYPVNPHNQYLLIGVEAGLCGIALLLALFITLAWKFSRSAELDAKLGLGVVVAIAVGCLANSWLLDFVSMMFFVTMTGILAGCLGPGKYSPK